VIVIKKVKKSQVVVSHPQRSGNRKLYEEHSKFVCLYFERNEFATLKSAATAFEDKFNGLTIATSGLHQLH
jgi:hypothetical protein